MREKDFSVRAWCPFGEADPLDDAILDHKWSGPECALPLQGGRGGGQPEAPSWGFDVGGGVQQYVYGHKSKSDSPVPFI